MESVVSFDSLISHCGLPRTQARQLLEHVSGKTREWLIAHGDEAAGDAVQDRFDSLVTRRRQHEPIAYLTGSTEFCGHAFEVNRHVLIPRPETEMLARRVIEQAPANSQLLELGCGSGALCISIARERPDLFIVASDIDSHALRVARRNALLHGCQAIRFVTSDWFTCFGPQAQFATILSNPPYVADNDPHLTQDGLTYEPQHALVSGPDGLDAIRIIGSGARAFLGRSGELLLEHGFDQHEATQAILRAAGFHNVWSARDFAGNWRITGGLRTDE